MLARINVLLFYPIFLGTLYGASLTAASAAELSTTPYSCIMVHNKCIWELLIKDTIAQYPDIAFTIAHARYFPKAQLTGDRRTDHLTQRILHHADLHHNHLLCDESIKVSGAPAHIITKDYLQNRRKENKEQATRK